MISRHCRPRSYRNTLAAALAAGFIPILSHGAPLEPLPPLPTKHQLAWQELETIAFAHFGVNTFTDREWGDGKEDPELFNPTEFDARQWAKVLRDAGMKLLILTAKHHDGFCLWPSQYTEHSVKNSPWRDGKGDIVREIADACKEYGIKFGVYLSPWDRNASFYGDSPVYNEHFCNQLRELLTQYGEITEVWFDGACGEGPNGKRQEYDFDSFYGVVRELQPNATIAIMGPDVRWVGNESGVARETEWSVQIVTEKQREAAQYRFNPTGIEASTEFLVEGEDAASEMLVWHPAECDVSIRPGWFYHPDQDERVKSLDHLLDIYFKSVGRNSVLLLNIPPDKRGLIHENDAARLRALNNAVKQIFRRNLAKGKTATAGSLREGELYGAGNVTDNDPTTYWAPNEGVAAPSIEVDLGKSRPFDVALLREPVALGQRIAEFKLEAWNNKKDQWFEIAAGTTIGYKRALRFSPVQAQKIRLTITKSRACPAISAIELYKRPPVATITPQSGAFLDQQSVTIGSDIPGIEILYTTDGSEPSLNANRYTGPFTLTETTTVRAMARGGFRIADGEFTKVYLREPVTPTGRSPGLQYLYYEGGWQSLQDMPHAQAVKTGNVGAFDTAPRQRDEHFAFRYTGFIKVPKDGIYTFHLRSDDGSRLSIGDSRIVDFDGLHGMAEKSGSVGLKAGLHSITVQYFNATGGRGLEVLYEGPGIEKQEIPAGVLSHTAK